MGTYRNPKTGQIFVLPEKYDTETGIDSNRTAAVAKGYVPVQVLTDKSLKKQVALPEAEVPKAREKGWRLPFEVAQGAEGEGLRSGDVSRDEVQTIANKYNVPFEEVDKYLEMTGARPDYRKQDTAAASLWTVSRSAGMNIANFIRRESQAPEVQRAISDLQDLADQRRSTVGTVAEVAGSMAVPIGGLEASAAAALGKTMAPLKAASVAATTGGIQGLASSREGEELSSMLMSAALSGTLGAATSRVFRGKTVPPSATENAERATELAEEVAARQGKTVQGLVQEARKANETIISTRRAYTTGRAAVDADALEKHGRALVDKPVYAKAAEKARQAGADEATLFREIASVDLDVETVRLARELGFTPTKKVAAASMVKAPQRFAGTVAKAKQYLKEYTASPDGVRKMDDAFERLTDVRLTKNVMKNQLRHVDPDAHWKLKHAAEAIIDGKYVMRGIDRRLGFNGEQVIADMDDATNQLTMLIADAGVTLKKLERAAEKAGLDASNMRAVIERPGQLTPEQQQVVRDIGEFFEDMRQRAGALGLNIQKRENYFPHIMPNMPETISRVMRRFDDAATKLTDNYNFVTAAVADEATERAFKELQRVDPDAIRAVQLLVGRAQPHKTGADFLLDVRRAINPGSEGGREFTDATAMYLREDRIPEFLLVNNLRTGGLNWVQETFRHALLRDHLSELTRMRDVAAAAKDHRAAAYLTGLLQDLTGMRPNSLATMARKGATAVRVWADRQIADAVKNPTLGNRVRARVADTLVDGQQIWPTLLNSAYPNFLGLSPRAALMNLSQLGTMTVPELGAELSARYTNVGVELLKGAAGQSEFIVRNPLVAKHTGVPVGQVFRPKTAKEASSFMSLYLENKKFKSEMWSQELVNAMQSDIKKGVGMRAFEYASEKYTRTAMVLFSATETFNRFTAAKIGERLAKDVLAKDEAALKWVRNIKGPGVQKRIVELMQSGNAEELEHVVQQYLISKTILNYTRQSMSNFGRFMGPMFSMFTKWPTTIAGEVVEQYATQGLTAASAEVGRRFLVPWVTLAGLGAALKYAAEQEGQEQRLRALEGSRGIQGWAPVTSLEALLGGEFLKSPAADIFSSAGKVLMNPVDGQKWTQALDDAAMTFVPGMAIGRFVMEDWTRLVENEDPTRFKPASLILETLGIKESKDE